MPSSQTQAYTSGHTGGLWNAHEHKKGVLTSLTVDNKHTVAETIKVIDSFTTDASKTGSAGATQAAENLGTTNVLSGKIRIQLTVPAGEAQNMGENELKDIEFLGKSTVLASAESSQCIIVAQYKLK